MNFRILLPNQRIKNIQCPSDVGVWQFLTRYGLKGQIQPNQTNDRVDLVLDEDGNSLHSELELIEEWVV